MDWLGHIAVIQAPRPHSPEGAASRCHPSACGRPDSAISTRAMADVNPVSAAPPCKLWHGWGFLLFVPRARR